MASQRSPIWYRAFFSRNFVWLLAVFIYIKVILSAIEVGLSTERLQESKAVQDVSYSVSIVSLTIVLAIAIIILCAWLLLYVVMYLISKWKSHELMSQMLLIFKFFLQTYYN